MWKSIQEYLGPVPAPIFVFMFLGGLAIAFIACAPTKWVERGEQAFQRWQERRKSDADRP